MGARRAPSAGDDRLPHLSKSRFVVGLQCHKRLWWQVREPDAPELLPDPALRAIFERGSRVGELARTHVPGGVLIDLPPEQLALRVAATERALAEGAQVVYEASFCADGVFAAVDILERRRGAFLLVEVKSTLDVKEAHLPDVAVQLHVLRRAGLNVARAELMHLNRACRHPDLTNLFVREDVTARAQALLASYPGEIAAQRTMLTQPLPVVVPGDQCHEPYECPFLGRCWPEEPEHAVTSLFGFGAKRARALEERGWRTIHDLPADFAARGPALRQLKSVREGRLVVEPGLGEALARLERPLACLDFETVAPPVPAWPGCGPYEAVPVQFSLHAVGPRGGLSHHAFLADGAADPREPLARALTLACRGAKTVLAYNAGFERACLAKLALAVPALGPALQELSERLADLLPIVRDHVYHPAFGGSFSLKSVLPALVPTLGYADLEVADGETASALLERLLLDGQGLGAEERARLRRQLEAYCERDTLALVRLLERLSALA